MADPTPNRSLEAILLEANADARAFAEGCDDLVGAILRATRAGRVNRTILLDAVARHHARLATIQRGLHHQSSGSGGGQ